MQFHKKANQQFQTLSSIDSEGHKTYKGLYAAAPTGGDFHLHKLDYLNQNITASSPAEQYEDLVSSKKEEKKPAETQE